MVFTKRLQELYVKTVSRLGCTKTSPTKKSLLTWSKYGNPCSGVWESFGDGKWGAALMCCTQGRAAQRTQWWSHPYVQGQEHDKKEETAICAGQVWATRISPNPGLITSKSNQTFYPQSPTDLEAHPILPKETSNWKFRLNPEVVNLTVALV